MAFTYRGGFSIYAVTDDRVLLASALFCPRYVGGRGQRVGKAKMQDADIRSREKRTRSKRYLDLLRGQIDITQVPFSDRGSRLVIQQEPGQNCLLIKLAER